MKEIAGKIAAELGVNHIYVQNTIRLLIEDECTIPFVARYRKEVTGSMDEVAIRTIRERYSYLSELEASKERYLKVVELICKTNPARGAELPLLREKFAACQSKQELEDLYLPFKPKRLTRAKTARDKGLEPLVQHILRERAHLDDLLVVASAYVSPADNQEVAAELRIGSPAEALQGAADILAESLSETAEYRQLVRDYTIAQGFLVAGRVPVRASPADKESEREKTKKSKVDPAKYENYFDYREPIRSARSHRIMAVRRGEADKVLRTGIEVDSEQLLAQLAQLIIHKPATSACVSQWLQGVLSDAYRRLLAPTIASEIRLQLKNQAEQDAITIFAKNLENLLLQPPVATKVVLGVDPGFQSGCKLAVVSSTGKYIDSDVIHPLFDKPDHGKTLEAKKQLAAMIARHDVSLVAIGNGTASKETDRFVISVIKAMERPLKRVIVSEAGASVYSASDLAREEFPELDATIRSAISIARRLQDPLAELVKIDPRSIGVGQYQHDCNTTRLEDSLKDTVESCVNRVGVNVNTASYKLLSYVSGIGASLAKNIVNHRNSHGAFSSRAELNRVGGLGPKAFQQAAGFLRIPQASLALDNSAVHPECYALVEQMAADLQLPVAELVGNRARVEAIPLENYVSATVGMPTLKDIAAELLKPGHDPRADSSRLIFSDEVSSIGDLHLGMKLKGTVSNVTNFGAFVDIGVHQDGLIHISELSNQFVDDPSRVIAVGDILDVYVIGLDLNRNRISLSRKTAAKTTGNARPAGANVEPRRPAAKLESRNHRPGQRNEQPRNDQQRNERSSGAAPRFNQQAPRRGEQGGRERSEQYQRGAAQRPGEQDSSNRQQLGQQQRAHQSSGNRPQAGRAPSANAKKFTMDDLLSKFNGRS